MDALLSTGLQHAARRGILGTVQLRTSRLKSFQSGVRMLEISFFGFRECPGHAAG